MTTDYYSDFTRVSNSMLNVLSDEVCGPENYYAQFIACTEKREPTADMNFGNLVHCCFLEPEFVEERYFIMPPCDRRTKEGKEIAAQAAIKAVGKTIVTVEESTNAWLMSNKLMVHEEIRKLADYDFDVERIFHFNVDGVHCKAKLDAYFPELNLILDIKTASDASPAGFKASCFKYGYDRQAYFYQEAVRQTGVATPRMVFAVVSKKEPFQVGLYELDSNIIFLAEQEQRRLLTELTLRKKNDNWRSNWTAGVNMVNMTDWEARKKLERVNKDAECE